MKDNAVVNLMVELTVRLRAKAPHEPGVNCHAWALASDLVYDFENPAWW